MLLLKVEEPFHNKSNEKIAQIVLGLDTILKSVGIIPKEIYMVPKMKFKIGHRFPNNSKAIATLSFKP